MIRSPKEHHLLNKLYFFTALAAATAVSYCFAFRNLMVTPSAALRLEAADAFSAASDCAADVAVFLDELCTVTLRCVTAGT
jgi:hypothetical protein